MFSTYSWTEENKLNRSNYSFLFIYLQGNKKWIIDKQWNKIIYPQNWYKQM